MCMALVVVVAAVVIVVLDSVSVSVVFACLLTGTIFAVQIEMKLFKWKKLKVKRLSSREEQQLQTNKSISK